MPLQPSATRHAFGATVEKCIASASLGEIKMCHPKGYSCTLMEVALRICKLCQAFISLVEEIFGKFMQTDFFILPLF
jgi:hypothetical protein